MVERPDGLRAQRSSGDGDEASDVMRVLADDWTWLAVCELVRGPRRQEDLERRLPPLSASAANERLHRLLRAGIAVERRIAARPPRIVYELTPMGREVVAIRCAASNWEARTQIARGPRLPGGVALGLLADEWMLPIMRRLAVGSRRRGEIEPRIPGLAEATLDDRLQRLRAAGVVRYQRLRGFPARVEYELTPSGGRLPAIALLASRWEWRWTRPARPQVATDLVGLVRFAAPLARAAEGAEGTCELAVRSVSAIERRVLVGVHGGEVKVLETAARAGAEPDTRAEGAPWAWCSTLVGGAAVGLELDGSAVLFESLVKALHGALSVDWPTLLYGETPAPE